MRVFHRPEDCRPGDAVDKKAVLDWPLMSNKSAVAFKRWVGLAEVQGKLVRKGNHIFEVGEADLAVCRYNHSREFRKDFMRHPVFCSIWDLDNCLADDEWRLRYVNRSLSGQAVWAEYNSHIPHDSAMHLDVFEAVRRAAPPVFFTGRVSTYRGSTEEWIRENLGVGLPIVYMRGPENKQSPADLKRSMLALLRRQRSEMQPVIAFDDLESIVTMYRECGVAAAVLRKYDPAKVYDVSHL